MAPAPAPSPIATMASLSIVHQEPPGVDTRSDGGAPALTGIFAIPLDVSLPTAWTRISLSTVSFLFMVILRYRLIDEFAAISKLADMLIFIENPPSSHITRPIL